MTDVIISYPIGSMYSIYTNIGGILMVNVTIYGIHGSYGYYFNIIHPIISTILSWRARPDPRCSPPSGEERALLGPKTALKNCTLWLCQNSYWTWPFIVDFPIKHGDVFHSYVKLPEGRIWQFWTKSPILGTSGDILIFKKSAKKNLGKFTAGFVQVTLLEGIPHRSLLLGN